MALAERKDMNMEQYEEDVRKMILDGYEQAKQGKVKSFDAVCDRLEKKYRDASL